MNLYTLCPTVLFACILPLQGMLNSFVYFYPKFYAVRKRDGISMSNSVGRVLDISVASQVSNFSSSVVKTVRRSLSGLRRSDGGDDHGSRPITQVRRCGSVHEDFGLAAQAAMQAVEVLGSDAIDSQIDGEEPNVERLKSPAHQMEQ